MNVITSPSQKYSSGALEVKVATGGAFTLTVIDCVLVSVIHPLSSIILIVTMSPFAMAFAPTVEEVNVLLPLASCCTDPLTKKV